MRATENAGFSAKVQRNIATDRVTKQHKSLRKLQLGPTSLQLTVSEKVTC